MDGRGGEGRGGERRGEERRGEERRGIMQELNRVSHYKCPLLSSSFITYSAGALLCPQCAASRHE